MTTIVIVDDRAINRSIFEKLALAVGASVKVQCFASPFDALAFMESTVPDLIITDYSMPEMDGAELTQKVRALDHCSDVPVVVITVFTDRSFRIRALEAGATDFLQSPVDHNEFVSRARNLLALREEQNAVKRHARFLEQELVNVELQRKEALRDSRERLAQVIDSVPAMIMTCTLDGLCAFTNAAWANFLNSTTAELIGQDAYGKFDKFTQESNRRLDRKVFITGRALPPYEIEQRNHAGDVFHFIVTKSPLLDAAGNTTHVVTTATDISDRKRAEAHLLHIAHHDALTGLPNRTMLGDRIDEEIFQCRNSGRGFALHFLDLDRFKSINDALGHRIGDRLLEVLAERLLRCVDGSDLVARLGGDEFAILQTDLKSSEEALRFAQHLVSVVEETFLISGRELQTSASVGITKYPEDGLNSEELLRCADMAMYQSKADGGNTFHLFSSKMDHHVKETIALENELRNAIEQDQLELFYQPQINLENNEIVGAEALLRWNRPDYGVVAPNVFLGTAEEVGLILPIGEWVIFAACKQAKKWMDMGLDTPRIAINISPTQFRKQDVPQLLKDALVSCSLPPEKLEIEITENIVLHGSEATVRDLRVIREMGIAVSIDDFGTGYSSLAYLSRYSVDCLKIDRCFTRDMMTDPNSTVIIKAIVGLGASLDLSIIAEGVETREQVDYLKDAGCELAQGYLFGKPVPAQEFSLLLEQQSLKAQGQYPQKVLVGAEIEL
ncbi:Cyclic di-GMP phosphodiesterase Gmr [Pseudovibrio axinellae]|uniref:Cyclic di-GMP phosphodiesterase Gmr n=1 Tax=Pseudovibrio axinellae TaxID=989403 RepID=A0A165XSE3_9HYPH|nr:EAL domain-containing protein [Pseudovibrio axinellae]KZL17993.1 Cyclic di-GMP phosphodiesterase Gmr [Pseudovibrio axinellae]SER14177.1 response regulator receiver modulated diguanylate cyclase/phosphodiesterase with PAS/PAC sensor(s) [Pseudovibrio axinellae]